MVVPPSLVASTVRSVDVGFCSQRVPWSDDAGAGVADVATAALRGELGGFELPFTLDIGTGLPPGLGFGYINGYERSRGEPLWSVELGTRSGLPTPSDDRFCVETGMEIRTSADGFVLGVPILLGCRYDQAHLRFCGRFTTITAPEGRRIGIPLFLVTDEACDALVAAAPGVWECVETP